MTVWFTDLVCSEPAFGHAASLLHSSHWLSVARRIIIIGFARRIKYKFCILMFEVFDGTAPAYLTVL